VPMENRPDILGTFYTANFMRNFGICYKVRRPLGCHPWTNGWGKNDIGQSFKEI
jgi:hypothetical protein